MTSPLHVNNPHRGRYNFKELTKVSPELKEFIKSNPKGDDTIEFSDNLAVLTLNKALLKFYYGIEYWNIPTGFLCPPIPGRADYIHYAADLINKDSDEKNILDIGTGANLIYPIIGSRSFKWKFRATDIDPEAIENARDIVKNNDILKENIDIVLQENKSTIFKGIIKEDDYFDLTICNPPFHASLKEAQDSNARKVKNLNKTRSEKIDDNLNFGGQKAELWCPGGEMFFIKKMIKESVGFQNQVFWFTTLVSKNDNVRPLKRIVRKAGAKRIKIIEMSQGQKMSRILAWSFI